MGWQTTRMCKSLFTILAVHWYANWIWVINGLVITRSRSRSAYWDGRNGSGEFVASGVYFYTLSCGYFQGDAQDANRKVGVIGITFLVGGAGCIAPRFFVSVVSTS